jgi:endoglucanase
MKSDKNDSLVFDTLRQLGGAFGPSGHEHMGITDTIREMMAPFADDICTDNMGNLICIKRGQDRGRKILLMAHMDQIGLMVTQITDEGFLRVTPIGGLKTYMLLYRQVVFANGVHGVINFEDDGEQEKIDIPWKQLYVDIGACDKKTAEEMVAVADVCTYLPVYVNLGENRLAGPAMDNRAGCAILLEVAKRIRETRHEATFVFSVQEELGLRGAMVAAYSQQPDLAIAVDVCATGDIPGAVPMEVAMGKGAAIQVMDAHSISHVGLRRHLVNLAKKNNIPHQLEIMSYGGTDGAAIQKSRGGAVSATLSIPSRCIHSACEVVDRTDMQSCIDLLADLLCETELAVDI